MKYNKLILILLGGSVFLTTSILVFYLRYVPAKKDTLSSVLIPTPTITPELATWNDQSGFTFQYPNSLKLDPHDEDKDNYAHLELTSATYSGNLIIWAKDTDTDNLDDWVKRENLQGSIDTSLGTETAKKIITGDESRKIIMASIHNGYLYEVEANPTDKDFWMSVLNTISSSFKFTNPQVSSVKDSQSGQDSNDESNHNTQNSGEEEIIE